MTTRQIIKQVRVYDANGQACVAYREVTPLAEYGRFAVRAFEYGCLAVVLTFIFFLVATSNGWI